MSRGSWARAAGAAVASCLLIVPPLAAAPASATPTPTAPPTAGSAGTSDGASDGTDDGTGGAADLVVASVTPLELRPGRPVTVAGRVEGGSAGLTGARIEVRRATGRSTSVSSLERWTAPVTDTGSGDGSQEGTGPSEGSADSADQDEEDDGLEDPAESARTELEVDLGDIEPDGTVPFTVVLDGAELGLRDRGSAAGPYGLQLVLLSQDRVVDDERGFLVWSPPVEVAPTSLSSSLTLLGPPADGTTGLPDVDLLVEEVSPGGRLDRLLDAAVVLDADWLLDPTLLAGVAALAGRGPGQDDDPAEPGGSGSDDGSDDGDGATTDGATTDGPAVEPTDGTGQTPGAAGPDAAPGGPSGEATTDVEPSTPEEQPEPTGPSSDPSVEPSQDAGAPALTPTPAQVEAAARWLDELATGRDAREVVLTGWADPDPVRIRSADDPDDARAMLRTAQDEALPPALVEELLDGRARDDVLVATEGPVTARDLATLADGRSSLLLPEDAVPLEDPFALSYTPDEVTTVRLPSVGGGGTGTATGTATDPADGSTDGERSAPATSVTAVLVDPGLSADAVQALQGSPLAGTRLMARLATTTLQRPNDSRLLSVALPAQLAPAPGAADRLTQALDESQWVQQVGLSTALGTPPSDAPRARLAAGPPTPPVPGVQALLDAVADGRRVAGALGRPVDEDATVLLDLRAAATLSRRADLDAPALLAEQLRSETAAAVGGVRVVPGARITLAAAQAGLPVTVINDLDTEARLVLRVRSRSPRLQVPQADLPITVPPGQRAVVDVPVTAVASGRADVTSQLVTEDGRAWGEPATVTVTVATQVEGRVLGVVGAVVGVLFVLGAVRAFVRNRRGRELADQGQVQP